MPFSVLAPFALRFAQRKWRKMVKIAERFLPFRAFVELALTYKILKAKRVKASLCEAFTLLA